MTQSELKELTNLGAELGAAKAEIEALREQVRVLQSDANSWQSGYDKGRNDGGKHRKGEVEQLRQHKNDYMDAAEATRKALLAEIESLRNGLKNARYRIEQGRVWNGMGWTLTGLHAQRQQKALDEIEAALSQQAEPDHVEDMRAMVEPALANDGREAFKRYRLAEEFCVSRGIDDDSQIRPKILDAFCSGYACADRPAQTEQKPAVQRKYKDWAIVRQSESAVSIVSGATYVTFSEGESDKRMPWLVDFLSSLLAGAAPIAQTAPQGKFRMGDLVKKSTGSEWVGRVVGWYSTNQTPEGYAVESEAHAGSVQIYPAKALELVPMAAKEA